jgi:hypothetical protein
MCASPRQPEHEATDAAQRALEEEEETRLASASLTAGDPTGWFDRLYAAGARGQVPVPWRRRQAHPLLAHWASAQELSGAGQRAVVVGCGLGAGRRIRRRPRLRHHRLRTSPAQPSGSPGSASPVPPSGTSSLTCSITRRPGCAPTTWSSRSSPFMPCPTRPATRPSPTSAAWSDPVERCWPLPPFTMTTRPPQRSRPGHCGAPRSKRSALMD